MYPLQSKLPSPEDAALAKVSNQELSAFLDTKISSQAVSITDVQGVRHSIQMPTSALNILANVLSELGDGNTVMLVPVHAELTTQEGADILGISRPTLIKLLDGQFIPFTKTGNRRKIKYNDIRKYQQRLKAKRLAVLETLSAMDQELGLGY